MEVVAGVVEVVIEVEEADIPEASTTNNPVLFREINPSAFPKHLPSIPHKCTPPPVSNETPCPSNVKPTDNTPSPPRPSQVNRSQPIQHNNIHIPLPTNNPNTPNILLAIPRPGSNLPHHHHKMHMATQ